MENNNYNWKDYSNQIENNDKDDFREINYNKNWSYLENKVQFKKINLW